jgi:ABC-type glycerol-3-phosphate transport system permease component
MSVAPAWGGRRVCGATDDATRQRRGRRGARRRPVDLVAAAGLQQMLIALDPEGNTGSWRHLAECPDARGLPRVVFQRYWYLQDFWHQFGNSFIGIMTMALTVLISSLAGFALGRMRLGKGGVIATTALLFYTVPAYFLVIPFYRLMHEYGLMDSLWAVIAADVTFAIPYAVLILQWYGRLIPMELDEAAGVDGATPGQVYLRIYLP